MSELPTLYTISEAAKILKLHPQTVYVNVQRGRIRCCRLGRSIRITKSQIFEYLSDAENRRG